MGLRPRPRKEPALRPAKDRLGGEGLLPARGSWEFRAKLCTVLRRISRLAITELGLIEAAIEPLEFEISRYADGGHFAPHSRGNLRLYALPTASANTDQEPLSVDIMPEKHTLVLFPSWVWHEVLKVEITSHAWADSRFAVNCWFHRPT